MGGAHMDLSLFHLGDFAFSLVNWSLLSILRTLNIPKAKCKISHKTGLLVEVDSIDSDPARHIFEAVRHFFYYTLAFIMHHRCAFLKCSQPTTR